MKLAAAGSSVALACLLLGGCQEAVSPPADDDTQLYSLGYWGDGQHPIEYLGGSVGESDSR